MSSPLFAVVGDNTIDRYGGAEEVDFVGGNAVNVAVQLALAGERVRYYGVVGDDEDGAWIASVLEQAGVELPGLQVVSGTTAVTFISVQPDGERVFDHEEFGVTAQYEPRSEDLRDMARADWVQIGMVPDADALRSRLPDARIGQDCAVASGFAGLEAAFGSVGSGDAQAFASDALAGGAELAVVTRGARGALAFVPGEPEPFAVDAVPTQIVDTTGAGDSFVAGFVAATVGGSAVPAALAEGARRAAMTCGHRGGFPQRGRQG